MTVRILTGDSRELLRALPAESVQCIVSSPPYWRQRDYNMAGQVGLESTPEEYVAELVSILREARRFLRSDGTCWINIGDKWASGGNGGGGKFMDMRGAGWDHARNAKGWRKPPAGYKDKDLVGVPFMLAFAMRSGGWFWRQCNIWAKPNRMPESVVDRSTISHEYVLQFSKENDYYYNDDDARTPPAPSTETRLAQNVEDQASSDRANDGGKTNGPMKAVSRKSDKQRGHTRRHAGFNDRWDSMERAEQLASGSNLRSVWWIAKSLLSAGGSNARKKWAKMLPTICAHDYRGGCKPERSEKMMRQSARGLDLPGLMYQEHQAKPHKIRHNSQRQTCKVCLRPDRFDFNVPDALWAAIVPPEFQNGVVCLGCFDDFARDKGISYHNGVRTLYFAGDQATFVFQKEVGVLSTFCTCRRCP